MRSDDEFSPDSQGEIESSVIGPIEMADPSDPRRCGGIVDVYLNMSPP